MKEALLSRSIWIKLKNYSPASIYTLSLCAIYLIWRMLQSSLLAVLTEGWIDTAIHFAILFALVIGEIYFNRPFDKTPVPAALFLLLGCLVWLFSGLPDIIDLTILVWCCRKVDFKDIALISIAIIISLSLLIISLSQLGIIADYIWDPGTRNRHGLGFLYCTTPSHLFLNVALLWIFLRRNDLKAIEVAFILIIDFVIFFFTGSKNSFALVIFALCLWLLLCLFGNKIPGQIIQPLLGQWVFPIFALLSLIASLAYDPALAGWDWLNDILANRLSQTHAALFDYGVMPFGQELPLAGNGLTPDGVLEQVTGTFDTNFIDNSFMYILLHLGWITLVAAISIFFLLGKRAAIVRDKYLTLALFVMALHAIFDPQLISPVYNTFLFLLPSLMMPPNASCSWKEPLWEPKWLTKKNG